MLGDVAIRVGFLIGITLLGWSAGKRLKIDPAGLAVLLVYVISPVVIFVVIQESTAGLAYLSYSAGMWGLSSLSALLAWRFARRFWQDARLNFPAVSLTLPFTFGAFSVLEKSVITIMLATPMAGNVVVISSLLGVYPQKAALMVVSSTVLTLLTLPLIMSVAL